MQFYFVIQVALPESDGFQDDRVRSEKGRNRANDLIPKPDERKGRRYRGQLRKCEIANFSATQESYNSQAEPVAFEREAKAAGTVHRTQTST